MASQFNFSLSGASNPVSTTTANSTTSYIKPIAPVSTSTNLVPTSVLAKPTTIAPKTASITPYSAPTQPKPVVSPYTAPVQSNYPQQPVAPTQSQYGVQGVQVDANGEAILPFKINPLNQNGAISSSNLGNNSYNNVLDTRNYLQKLQEQILAAGKYSPEEQQANQNLADVNQKQLELKGAYNAEADRLMSSSGLTREQATGFLTETGRRANQQATNLALQQSAYSNVLAPLQAQRENELNMFKTLYGISQPVSVGGNLVNPTTGEVLYQGQRSPVSLSAGETLVDPITGQVVAGGATGGLLSIAEATQLGVPYGTTREEALGLQPYKPATEAQSKASMFATRVQDADTILKSNEASIVSQNPLAFQAKVYAEGSSLFNSYATDVIRQQRQAERNFLNSILRRESGAVISPTEFAEGAKQYFPRPADDAKTLEQKTRNREVAKQALIQEAGNAYTQTQSRLGSGTNSIDDSFFSPANF